MNSNSKMTQIEFSTLAKTFLAERYPAFLQTIVYKKDNSFDCTLKSLTGRLSIWIATYDSEITVGFDNSENICDWHTHMSLFGANEPMEELIAMSELLDSILSGKEPIVFSSKTGFTLTHDLETEIREKDEDETITIYKWNQCCFDVE